jgi:hypothetical protein
MSEDTSDRGDRAVKVKRPGRHRGSRADRAADETMEPDDLPVVVMLVVTVAAADRDRHQQAPGGRDGDHAREHDHRGAAPERVHHDGFSSDAGWSCGRRV